MKLEFENGQLEFENKDNNTIYTGIKCIDICLTKYVQVIFVKSCKSLMKVKENLNKWRDIPSLCFGRLNTVLLKLHFFQFDRLIHCHPN